MLLPESGGGDVAAADVDLDGIEDLIVISDATLVIALGNGNRTFQPFSEMSIPPNAYRVVAGEFDEVPGPDLAIAHSNSFRDGMLTIYTNDGTGGFSLAGGHPTNDSFRDLLVADVDADGRDDFVWATEDTPGPNPVTVRVYLGATGAAGPPMESDTWAIHFASMLLLDWNGDGVLDIATRDSGTLTDGVAVQLGFGNGTFSGAIVVTTGAAEGMTSGDINGDGLDDLIVDLSDDPAENLVAFHSTGLFVGAIDEIPNTGSHTRPQLYDTDSDGQLELITRVTDTSWFDGILYLHEIGPNLTLSAIGEYDRGTNFPERFHDFDNDGFLDYYGANHTNAAVVYGSESFLDGYPAGPKLGLDLHVLVGQFDDDDPPEAFSRHSGGLRLDVTETGRVEASEVTAPLVPGVMFVGDFDDDGIDEILSSFSDGRLRVFAWFGETSLVQLATSTIQGYAAAVGDLTADGIVDFVAAESSFGLRIYAGSPTGSFVQVSELPGPEPELVAGVIRDFDGDGHADLIAPDGGDVVVLSGDGTGNLVETLRFPSPSDMTVLSVEPIDYDQDGNLDLAFDYVQSNAAGVTRGFGVLFVDQQEWVTVQVPLNTFSISVGDLDGDLHEDLVCLTKTGIWIARSQPSRDLVPSFVHHGSSRWSHLADFTGDGIVDVFYGFAHGMGRPVIPKVTRGSICDGPFLRGDANADGALTCADAINALAYLFTEGDMTPCPKTVDFNDDARLLLDDVILLLDHLFDSGEAPSAPFPQCGDDPNDDAIPCETYDACD